MIKKTYLIQMQALITNGRIDPACQFLFQSLRANQLSFVILCEQSSRTRQGLLKVFHDAGMTDVLQRNIYSSAMAAVDWVVWSHPEKVRAAYFGGKGLQEALTAGKFVMDHQNPDWFFLGMDQNLAYSDYCDALLLLQSGAQGICVDNRRIQYRDSLPMIGNGSVTAMLSYASNTNFIDFGRGSRIVLVQALRYLRALPEQCIFVSDDFKKDLVPAAKTGMETILLTRGNSMDRLGVTQESHPDYIVETIPGLCK